MIVSGIYPPDHGGPARFIPQLAQACHERGWDVEVVTLSDDALITDKSPWRVNRISRSTPKWWRLPITTRMIYRCLRKADVMFANGLFEEASVAAVLARRPWVAKFVGDPVWERYRTDTQDHVSLQDFQSLPHGIRLRARRAWLTWSLRRARSVVTPSKELQGLLMRWSIKDVRYVPNGVELTPVAVGLPTVDVVTVSRLIPLKNVDVLIKACEAEGLSLDVAGDGPERDNLTCLLGKMDPTAPIRLLGALPADAIPKILDSSRLMALLSSHEGMSFALLEAMSRAKPVVVGDNPGNRAVVRNGENGLLVNHDEVGAVRVALRRLIDDPSYARSLGEAARRTVEERFSLDATIEVTLSNLTEAAEVSE